MVQIFTPNRSLLNAKFDGYKLQILEQDRTVQACDLPSPRATQSTMHNRTTAPPTFQEVHSRIKHNHLSSSLERGVFAYVDAERRLTLVRVDPHTLAASFHPIFEVPMPVSTSSTNLQFEYPVALALDSRHWFVSDGCDGFYLISYVEGSAASQVASYHYSAPDVVAGTTPGLQLHAAVQRQGDAIIAVVSYRANSPKGDSQGDGAARMARKATFEVVAVVCAMPDHSDTSIQPALAVWRRRGDSIPLSVEFDNARSAFLLIGNSTYSDNELGPDVGYVPSEDELAPIPRVGEILDGEKYSQGAVIPQLPPYSWTQTQDSVTIAFPLPSPTPASAIRVTITAKHLNLLVASDSVSPLIHIPRYLNKQWWGDVDASASFWTWDKEGDRQKGEDEGPIGLLTLHLEKRHDGTRWPHVFLSAGTGSADPQDVEVPETVDPSEMYKIRESLEKYTAQLIEGSNTGGMGFSGLGVPSLGQGEYDEEVDADTGIPALLTWVPEGGSSASWPEKPWPAEIILLSSALPMSSETQARQPSTLVIKHDIDGLLFQPPQFDESDTTHPGIHPWTHSHSFSALAFVLASKRDIRFVYHIDGEVVLAFEGGNRAGLGGENVYIYRAPSTKDARTADQAVLRIGGGDAGALLGVAGFRAANGKISLLCLCEARLIIIRDIV